MRTFSIPLSFQSNNPTFIMFSACSLCVLLAFSFCSYILNEFSRMSAILQGSVWSTDVTVSWKLIEASLDFIGRLAASCSSCNDRGVFWVSERKCSKKDVKKSVVQSEREVKRTECIQCGWGPVEVSWYWRVLVEVPHFANMNRNWTAWLIRWQSQVSIRKQNTEWEVWSRTTMDGHQQVYKGIRVEMRLSKFATRNVYLTFAFTLSNRNKCILLY